MTLTSQTSRPNAGRKYMVSRKRRPKRWPWVGVAVLAVLVLVIFRPWSSNGDAAVENDSPRDPAASSSARGENEAEADRAAANATPRSGNGSDAENQPATSVTARRAGVRSSGAGGADRDGDGEAGSSEGGSGEGGSGETGSGGSSEEAGVRRLSSLTPLSSVNSEEVAAVFAEGRQYLEQGRLVEGRSLLSALLFDPARPLPEPDAAAVRDMLTHANEKLVLSPEVVPGDPLAERYRVQRGDLLARIAPQYNVPYPFLERINRVDARRIQAGQPIKVIHGPFHARIVKSDYRMDVFLRGPDGLPIYVKSYPVGLGQADSTPLGPWRIEPGKKVTNPDWRNPRTGEYYPRDDPDNPIGEYWLALEGIDDETRDIPGYGIHGTVDPDSIGEQASMGCIRLRNGDIEEVFHMFVGGESTVEIVR